MEALIESFSAWGSALSGGEITAMAVAVLAVLFIFAAAKAALKIAGVVVGFIAVVYLVDPQVQAVFMDMFEKILEIGAQWF